MDLPTQNYPFCSCYQKLYHAFSIRRCCFFLFVFILFFFLALGVVMFVVFFYVKPREPVFSLQAVKLDFYKLDVYSDSTLFISSVISLTLNAVNPNKVGIRYSHSRLRVFNEGLVIGMIRIPSFYQPAHSKNVSVQTRVLFQCVNASQILSGVPQQHDSAGTIAKTRILGDIRARVQVLQTTLPKFKVGLDCEVDIDYSNLAFSNEVQSMRSVTSLANFPVNSQTFSNKCSIAFYI